MKAFAPLALAAALACSGVQAQAPAPKPQYGGELNIGNVFVTVNPMSADTGDWAWKHAQTPAWPTSSCLPPT